MPTERRPIRPGDILVLVRRRGKLFDAVLQALKRAHVPVAGADRLKLTEHIAIIDLMNLADAILLPTDDLALAVALKSPLFGITEEQLFTLAHGRTALAAPRRSPSMQAPTPHSKPRTIASSRAKPWPQTHRRLRSIRGCSEAIAAAAGSSDASVTKPATRSTSSSSLRCATSSARRQRCRASWRGCARPTSRSSATWKSRATRSA